MIQNIGDKNKMKLSRKVKSKSAHIDGQESSTHESGESRGRSGSTSTVRDSSSGRGSSWRIWPKKRSNISLLSETQNTENAPMPEVSPHSSTAAIISPTVLQESASSQRDSLRIADHFMEEVLTSISLEMGQFNDVGFRTGHRPSTSIDTDLQNTNGKISLKSAVNSTEKFGIISQEKDLVAFASEVSHDSPTLQAEGERVRKESRTSEGGEEVYFEEQTMKKSLTHELMASLAVPEDDGQSRREQDWSCESVQSQAANHDKDVRLMDKKWTTKEELEPSLTQSGSPRAKRKRDQAKFDALFPELAGSLVLDTFACAWEKEVLIQGRLFVTEENVSFRANLFGNEFKVVFAYDEIVSIDKKMTAGLFPNAIRFTLTRDRKYVFSSFLKRDAAYELLHQALNQFISSTGEKPLGSVAVNPGTPGRNSNVRRVPQILIREPTAAHTEKLSVEATSGQSVIESASPSSTDSRVSLNGYSGDPHSSSSSITRHSQKEVFEGKPSTFPTPKKPHTLIPTSTSSCPCKAHFDYVLFDTILSVHVETLFQQVFVDSSASLFQEAYGRNSLDEFKSGVWENNSKGVRYRLLTYKERGSDGECISHEVAQTIRKLVDFHYYVVESRHQASDMNDQVRIRYCLTHAASKRARLRVTAEFSDEDDLRPLEVSHERMLSALKNGWPNQSETSITKTLPVQQSPPLQNQKEEEVAPKVKISTEQGTSSFTIWIISLVVLFLALGAMIVLGNPSGGNPALEPDANATPSPGNDVHSDIFGAISEVKNVTESINLPRTVRLQLFHVDAAVDRTSEFFHQWTWVAKTVPKMKELVQLSSGTVGSQAEETEKLRVLLEKLEASQKEVLESYQTLGLDQTLEGLSKYFAEFL